MNDDTAAPALGDGRDETPIERLDRNWNDLLQELRVLLTGVQLLTGFLLTLPFQSAFERVTHAERTVYLTAVGAAILALGFLQAPVSVHRALFQRHRRHETVMVAHRLAIVGLACLAVAVVAVVLLIVTVLLGWGAGALAAGVTAGLLVGLWAVLPLVARYRSPQRVDAG